MATSRTKYKTIDEYIAGSSETVRNFLKELRQVIKESAPGAEETISYGIPTFKLKGSSLVHFAAFKDHISFFPGGPSAIEALEKELSPFKLSKGTVQFPLDKPIPVDLVKRMVKFRVKENEARKSK